MNELVLIRPATIGDEAVQAVDSFDLYRSLKVEAKHADWIKRRLRLANLREHFDFEVVLNSENNSAGRPEVHYLLSLDAAKHIAMMEKTPVAWEVRCYFIEREKDSRLGTDRIVQAARSAAIEVVETQIRLLRADMVGRDMFSLERWAKRAKCTLTPKQSRAIGGALAAKCRTHDVVMGYEPSRHHHGRPPRTFPRAILDLYFSRLLDKHAPALQLSLVKAEIA